MGRNWDKGKKQLERWFIEEERVRSSILRRIAPLSRLISKFGKEA